MQRYLSLPLIIKPVPLLILRILLGIQQSFAPLLCFSLWGKYGGHTSHFCVESFDVQTGWSCRAIGSSKPSVISAMKEMEFASFDHSLYLLSSLNLRHYLSTSLALCCYASACEEKWHPLFRVFMKNVHCDIPIGWSCWMICCARTFYGGEFAAMWGVERQRLTRFGHITHHDNLSKIILQGTLKCGRHHGQQRKC